jgi:hypothetical protein
VTTATLPDGSSTQTTVDELGIATTTSYDR